MPFAAAAALALSFFRAARAPDGWAEWRPLHLFASYGVVYICCYLLAATLGYTWHGVQERHIMPLYLPLFIAILIALDRLLLCIINQVKIWRNYAVSLLAGGLGCWLALAIALQPLAIRDANAYGIGSYASPNLRNSELIRYVSAQFDGGGICAYK